MADIHNQGPVEKQLNNPIIQGDLVIYGEAKMPRFLTKLPSLEDAIIGREHPSTARSQSNLASVYQDLGRYEQAVALWRQAYQTFHNSLGAEHPNTKVVQEFLDTYDKDTSDKGAIATPMLFAMFTQFLRGLFQKRIHLILFVVVSIVHLGYGQVQLAPISPVSTEKTNVFFCFNNTKLMVGKSTDDRYLVYYSPDTIFLNVHTAGIWTKKYAYAGANIQSATLSQYKDTIWICWKEGPFIKTRNTPDRGKTWSNVLQVSQGGMVSAPSISAASNGKVHFVWSTATTNSATVYHRTLVNGAFVSAPMALSNNGAKGLWPSIITIGDTLLCAWKEEPLPSKVWFRSSLNGGNSWNASALTSTALAFSKDPNLAYAYHAASKTHYLYIAYDGQNNIYFQRSTNFGRTWTNPEVVSRTNKLSQFAHLESNNNGFVGISYEQSSGTNIFDDSKKDVGFVFSNAWGNSGSFGSDSLAYTKNGFGSLYPALNKVDDNNFFLTWLSKDTIANKIKIAERRVFFSMTTSVRNPGEAKDSDFSLYPNPGNDLVYLHSDHHNINSIKIYHSNGTLAARHSTSPFRINDLAAGLYFVVVEANNKIWVRKLVKLGS